MSLLLKIFSLQIKHNNYLQLQKIIRIIISKWIKRGVCESIAYWSRLSLGSILTFN